MRAIKREDGAQDGRRFDGIVGPEIILQRRAGRDRQRGKDPALRKRGQRRIRHGERRIDLRGMGDQGGGIAQQDGRRRRGGPFRLGDPRRREVAIAEDELRGQRTCAVERRFDDGAGLVIEDGEGGIRPAQPGAGGGPGGQRDGPEDGARKRTEQAANVERDLLRRLIDDEQGFDAGLDWRAIPRLRPRGQHRQTADAEQRESHCKHDDPLHRPPPSQADTLSVA